MLLDTNAKVFYVGEAADLVKRLVGLHPSIPNWNFFRYNVLPLALEPFRVQLERMVIRDFAAVLKNKNSIDFLAIADCCLANDKIDK